MYTIIVCHRTAGYRITKLPAGTSEERNKATEHFERQRSHEVVAAIMYDRSGHLIDAYVNM